MWTLLLIVFFALHGHAFFLEADLILGFRGEGSSFGPTKSRGIESIGFLFSNRSRGWSGAISPTGHEQQDGRSLEFASQEMKGDRELCTAAVAQSEGAIAYMSNELKADVTIVRNAVQAYKKKTGHSGISGFWLRSQGVP